MALNFEKNVQQNVQLAPYTSWLIGGPADYFCLPTTVEEVIEAQNFAQSKDLPITVLGAGSNVLVSDKGVRGLVICMKKLSGVNVVEDDDLLLVEALAGTSKSEILKTYLKYKLPPALFLAGLPGDVAGGIVMNAGVAEDFRPREFFEITDWFEVLKPDGEIVRYEHDRVLWSYRHSHGWQPGIIVKAGLSWPLEADVEILEKVKTANKTRLTKQPLDMPSCGSVFVNPKNHKAAQLIDQAGLKGFQIGGAQVSTKHANFIVNIGGATAFDVLQVIQHVRQTVFQKNKIDLKTEVVLLGDWPGA